MMMKNIATWNNLALLTNKRPTRLEYLIDMKNIYLIINFYLWFIQSTYIYCFVNLKYVVCAKK